MNAPTALTALLSQAAEPARLREIPYNYTSFSDREIVIRLLGERGWELLDDPARQSAAPAARRACCTRCWATSGWSSAIPTCRTTCWTIQRRRSLLVDALHHRLTEVEKRRTPDTDAERDALRGRADQAVARAGRRRVRHACSARRRGPARARRAHAARLTAKDNIKFDGLVARVARDRRHRLARRVSVRRADARHRGRDAPRWSRAASSSA